MPGFVYGIGKAMTQGAWHHHNDNEFVPLGESNKEL
jgi:hypothetical protein